jgi:hypothetical protein
VRRRPQPSGLSHACAFQAERRRASCRAPSVRGLSACTSAPASSAPTLPVSPSSLRMRVGPAEGGRAAYRWPQYSGRHGPAVRNIHACEGPGRDVVAPPIVAHAQAGPCARRWGIYFDRWGLIALHTSRDQTPVPWQITCKTRYKPVYSSPLFPYTPAASFMLNCFLMASLPVNAYIQVCALRTRLKVTQPHLDSSPALCAPAADLPS